jgi:Ca2+-binding EF-hand superfamily protein
VLAVIKLLCDGIQNRKLTIRQLATSMDINLTGFVSRPEFVTICQQLSDLVTLEQTRIVSNFLDDKNTGKINIMEFLKICTETLNTQIGGGVYSFKQV